MMKKRIIAVILTISMLFSTLSCLGITVSAQSSGIYTGNLAGGGFESEDDMWTVTYQSDETVSVDTATTHNSSNGALRVDLVERRSRQIMRVTTTTAEGVAANFDISKRRYLELYIKTSSDFAGSVYARVKQDGYLKNDGTGAVDFCFIGTTGADGAANTEWKLYKTTDFEVSDTDDVEVTLYFNGTGTVWVDDVTIAADNNYIVNGGFENGIWANWNSVDGVYETAEVVTDVTCNSDNAAKLTNTGTGEMFIVTGHKAIDPLRNYTLSLDIKTEGVSANGVFVRILQRYTNSEGSEVGAWLRYYGKEEIISTGGTQDWTNYSINIGSWNENLTSFTLYIYLNGSGTAYFDNVSLTTVELADLAAGEVGVDIAPGEVNALDVVHLYTSDAATDIYYTTDGTDPRTSATAALHKMKSGIIITENTTIRACTSSVEGKGAVYEFGYTVASALIPDDALFANSSNSSAVSLDTATCNTGANSIKLTGTGSHICTYTDNITIDALYDYKLEFWVKTEGLTIDDTAYVTLFLPGGSLEKHTTTGEGGVYYISKNGIADIKSTQEWTKYEYIISGLANSRSSVKLTAGITTGYGSMWIDGIKLTAVQKETYPISVLGDGSVYGNNYYNNTDTDFVIEQGIDLTNNTESTQSGLVNYNVYNDLNPDTAIGSGSFEAFVAPGATENYKISLPEIDHYGTFTVEFTVTGNHGYTYSAGSVSVARLQDNSGINNDTMFGVCTNTATTDYQNLQNAGVSMVRTDLDWEKVETADDTFAIPSDILAGIEEANSHNIDTIVIFNSHNWPSFYEYTGTSLHPNSGFPRSDAQIAEFVEYVEYVVTALKGKVTYYELFNETNFMSYSICTGAEYANLLKYVYPAIKAIDPDANLIMGGPSGYSLYYIETILAAGGADYLDYICTHPYIYPTSPESAGFDTDLDSLNTIIARYTDKVMPIIFSEVGWSSCVTTRGNTEQEKAEYFTRAFAMASAAGNVERITLYREGSSGNLFDLESRWGAFNRENSATLGTANPMAVALSNFTAMMDKYTFDSKVSLADGLYAYKYAGSDTDMYMLWTDDNDYTASITVSDTSVKVYDIYGNPVSVTLGGSSFDAKVGGSPIYVTLAKGGSITAVAKSASVTAEGMVIRDFNTADQGFSGTSVDTSSSFEGEGSLKIDMTAATEYNLNINLDTAALSQLDANVRYAVRLHAKGSEDFSGYVYTNVWAYDGDNKWTMWYNYYYGAFEMIGNIGSNTSLSSDWQGFTFASDTGMVVFGNKMQLQLCVRGAAAGTLWIDKIELIPIDDNSQNHGRVAVTGYDETSGRTVYTAIADNGYELEGIAANLGSMSTYKAAAVEIEILKEISATEVQFTVNLDDITPDSTLRLVSRADHRFIKAAFTEKQADLPMLSPEESFVLNDFETADQTLGSNTCLDADNPAEGSLSLKVEFTTSNQIISDIYVNADEMKNFDANNAYFVRAKYRSTEDFAGRIWSNTYMIYGATSRALSRAAYKGDLEILGSTESSQNVTPGTEWVTITSAQSVPVIGEKVRFQLNILRTSSAGTLWIDEIELVPAYDNTALNGYVTSGYDSANDRLVLTAHGLKGYKPKSLTVTPYNYNGYKCTEVPSTVCGKPGVGKVDYTFTFDKVNENDSYLVIFNGSYRFITAAFMADSATLMGDCTLDSLVDLKDLIRFKKYSAGATFNIELINIDFDNDGYALVSDMVTLRKKLLGF